MWAADLYGALRLNLAPPPAGNAHVGCLTSIPRMAKMYFENNRFSERENDVIKLLTQGKSNKQIAFELRISNRTVEFHLSNIYTKLGVKSRSEAILKVTDSQLRKSTGGYQVLSTVDNSHAAVENSFKSILRRIGVKKSYYLIAGLSTAVLFLIMVIVKLPTKNNVEC